MGVDQVLSVPMFSKNPERKKTSASACGPWVQCSNTTEETSRSGAAGLGWKCECNAFCSTGEFVRLQKQDMTAAVLRCGAGPLTRPVQCDLTSQICVMVVFASNFEYFST